MTASSGYNVHEYTKNYKGWYLKLGTEYRLWKGLTAGLRLWHSSIDEFPARLKLIPFSADDEDNFIKRFIGISHDEWLPPNYKGFYQLIEANIASISLGYEFRIRKKIYVTPHYAFSILRAKDITVGLYEASFLNNRLVSGKVFYDIRIGNMTAGSVGLKVGYKLNERWKLYAEAEDIRALNGTNWISYDAKSLGAGVSYMLK